MLHIALAGLGFIDQVMPDAERAYAELDTNLIASALSSCSTCWTIFAAVASLDGEQGSPLFVGNRSSTRCQPFLSFPNSLHVLSHENDCAYWRN
jgi:hypothetical protein